jgi:hypothetical protein
MEKTQMLEQTRRIAQITPGKAIVFGVGALLLAPTVISLLKPVAKATIKTGVVLYEKTKGSLAEAGEVLGDIVAEAKAEVMAEQNPQGVLPSTVNSEPSLRDS